MQTSGLTNAPISKCLLIYTIAASVALAIFDVKHLVDIHVTPHFFPYSQFWRIAVWQVAGFANSTEALFAAMLAYHLRVVERAWGKRKMATFLLTILLPTTLLPPLILTTLLRPLTLSKLNYLPSGPTALLFALLAQYHASIPATLRYSFAVSGTPSTGSSTSNTASPNSSSRTNPSNSSNNNNNNTSTQPATEQQQHQQQQPPKYQSQPTITLTDKSTTYLIALQLALSQFPATILPAVVGWGVGLAWRTEVLPLVGVPGGYRWRVPGWVVGDGSVRAAGGDRSSVRGGSGGGSGSGGERYEELRRRLEGEVVAASASSTGTGAGEGAAQRVRRGMGLSG
ncbi:protein dscB [Aspergillus saccharolyticus JOP 1030-1]|uniref:Peptidase S54 rhomboid domain-containing protein n=1 Tax=Aspergillus saccharolyticus JOP 1030-1 TaxID=1450539 RepID=A0A318ZNJ0_9EURO|nr:hypothetical protein BP01DRAFT_317935 [Aspergillus saccharolyticus JOP 1030-1]PYH46013.1 hypothetical protein BP01DRAFT_317935 [Aspergillus saccharolyticus JOP 1030-1]